MRNFLTLSRPDSKKYIWIILLTHCVLLCNGCQKTVESLADLSVLRMELMAEFPVADMDVVIQNSHILGISVLNSTFNDLSEVDKGMKAREIALFAKSHYRSIDTIDQIWVQFVVRKTFVFFNYSETTGVFRFETRDMLPPNPADSTSPGNIVTSYNPALNQVDIYLKKNLQLTGKFPGNATLLPHFVIPCAGVAPRRLVPKSVTLDFTTSSKDRMFEDQPQLVIYLNQRKVFSERVQNTNVMGSDSEKSVNEFLSQEITYSQFLELTNGDKVKIALGAWNFELTPIQVKELQDMRKQTEEGTCR